MDLICDSVLKKWFQAREEELAVIDENDKEFLNQDNANRGMKQKLLFNELEKIKFKSEDVKKNVFKLLEEYVDAIDYQCSYFNEKYYFEGLKDGINMYIELLYLK